MTKDILQRFFDYIKIDTCSMEDSEFQPSTLKQHDLAKLLYNQLCELGVEHVYYDEKNCYIYGIIPATKGYEKVTKLGFIAHMDTSPAMSGASINPKIVYNYDGNDICLNEEQKIIMYREEFPELMHYVGQDLICTDGTTLLGADDKAGIAEIMYMTEYFLLHPEISHGQISIAFTPDEEIGNGTAYFDLERFDAEVAYTVDGGALGEIEYENFNAAGAKVRFHGKSVHPGYAKGKMINSLLLAMEFQGLLPVSQNPMYTEGYEGFFHLDHMDGGVEEAIAEYIIRDHDRSKFEEKKKLFLQNGAYMNEKYGHEVVTIDMRDSYYNMKEIMTDHMDLVEKAVLVMEEMGGEPKTVPIRGGTDGATLSFKGLPCPNLCTGGENFHGKYEYIPVQSLQFMGQYLICLVQKFI